MSFFLEYWQLIAVFFAGVLASAAGISYFFYYMKYKSKKRSRVQNNSGSSHAVDSTRHYTALQEIKQELAAVRKQLEERKKEFQALKDEVKTARESTRSVEFDIENNSMNRYFSVPSKNGTFPEEKGSKKENENTWYRIEYERNESVGKLFYLAGKSDKRALNQMDSFLKPVCEFENAGKANPQKIQLVHPGQVVLKDGTWSIEKKIKLRLS